MARPVRILIVDDDEYVARTFEAMLHDLAPVILQARTATEGLATARLERPDLALLDVGLPDGDGFALAARLREEPELADLRIVIVTGYELDPERPTPPSVDAILQKPIRLEQLRELIGRLLVRSGSATR